MTERTVSHRAQGLDLAKYICSFMVICIHMPYWGKSFWEPLTRIAVPFFFMITGYFYASVRSNGRAIGQIRKVCMLFLHAHLAYMLLHLVSAIGSGRALADVFGYLVDPAAWFKLFFFNLSPVEAHLWYIGALLYALVIIFLFERHFERTRLHKLIPVLLLLNVTLGNYSSVLLGSRMPLILTRNFLFAGLPFILLGDYLNCRRPKIRNSHLIIVLILSILLTTAENRFLLNSGKPFNDNLFFATPILSLAAFLLVLQNEDLLNRHSGLAALARIGRKTATAIYIAHPIVRAQLDRAAACAGVVFPAAETLYFYFGPVLVLLASTVFAWLFDTALRKLRQCLLR